jgi:hypothetical protein
VMRRGRLPNHRPLTTNAPSSAEVGLASILAAIGRMRLTAYADLQSEKQRQVRRALGRAILAALSAGSAEDALLSDMAGWRNQTTAALAQTWACAAGPRHTPDGRAYRCGLLRPFLVGPKALRRADLVGLGFTGLGASLYATAAASAAAAEPPAVCRKRARDATTADK